MALMLELVASSLLLLPWSCWWTEVSEGPAWSLNPLQEEERGVSSFAPYGCNPEPPRASASRTESPLRKGQMKYGQKSTKSSTAQGQAPQKDLKLRSCAPSSTPWPCVVLPTLSIRG